MTLKLEQLVELKDQYSNVYPLSPTGARGWVRGRRELTKSDPEVYIEWDKTHWRYHGEKDGWTFEHHFQPVTDEVPTKVEPVEFPTSAGKEMSELVRSMVEEAKGRVEAEKCPSCGQTHDTQDEFITTLQEAQDAALGADGYFIVTLTPQKVDGYTVYEPKIFANAMTDAAQQMIEAQLVHVASQLFEQRILKHITDVKDDGR